MTLQEFKAWFEGFTESMHGEAPTTKQWKRIQERVGEIDGTPVTERVFIDRYWPYYYPYAGAGSFSSGYGTIGLVSGTSQPAYSGPTIAAQNSGGIACGTNSIDAMYAAGKAEAQAAVVEWASPEARVLG